MKLIDSEDTEKKIYQEHKLLAKNTFYSFFTSYGNLIFQIIISFLVARLISKEAWGFLILATSYVLIVTTISYFLPPALDYSLNYYIPRYISLNQKTKLKSFIKNAIFLKLLFLIPIFFISTFIFQIFSELFTIKLKDHTSLLYLLSPLIIIIGFNPILNAINRSFNMYKTVFLLLLISFSFQISALLICFLFIINVNIELLALIQIFTSIISFIINCFIITIKLYKIENSDEKGLLFKEFSRKVFKYGFPLSFGYFIYGFWNQIQIQGIGFFNTPENVTGYNISLNYSEYSRMAVSSLSLPLLTSFTRLNSTQNYIQIILIYNRLIKYSLFLLLLFSGLLYFLGDFFLFFIYGESYTIFSIFLKMMIISIIFRFMNTPFDALILAQNRSKYIAPIRVIMMIIYCSLFFIGLIYYGILGAILGIIISNFLILLLYTILSFKILKININIKKIISQYLIFFIGLGITFFLETILLKELNYVILQNLNLLFFKYIPFLSILTFLIIFIFLNIFLKTFSRKDFEYLESFFNKDNKFHKLIRKGLRFFKKYKIFAKK